MKITNKHNIHEAIHKAISFSRKPIVNRLSVTELIAPPLIRKLKMLNWDALEEDASERLWALLGQCIHVVLERANLDDALHEEKLQVELESFTLTGKPDLLHGKELSDWKITSVYSFLLGEKKEWVKQLNVYRWLYEKIGFQVSSLNIHAILRDWNKTKATTEADYPSIPFMSVSIPLMEFAILDAYITHRVRLHKQAQELDLEHFTHEMICSDEERWKRPDTWAVKKKGNQRAIRVFENETAALEFANSKKALEIEFRKGVAVRCESYCIVSQFCPFKKGGKLE